MPLTRSAARKGRFASPPKRGNPVVNTNSCGAPMCRGLALAGCGGDDGARQADRWGPERGERRTGRTTWLHPRGPRYSSAPTFACGGSPVGPKMPTAAQASARPPQRRSTVSGTSSSRCRTTGCCRRDSGGSTRSMSCTSGVRSSPAATPPKASPPRPGLRCRQHGQRPAGPTRDRAAFMTAVPRTHSGRSWSSCRQ